MDVELRLLEIYSKINTIKYLLLGTHFQLDKIMDTSKEIGSNIARVCVKMDHVIKKETYLIAKTWAIPNTLSTTT